MKLVRLLLFICFALGFKGQDVNSIQSDTEPSFDVGDVNAVLKEAKVLENVKTESVDHRDSFAGTQW